MTVAPARDAAERDALVESLCGDLSAIRAPRGSELNARSWAAEAPLRMLLNNLDAEVAERPDDLVVYGGTGKAARSWEAFDVLARELRALENDETLLVQSGKPVGVFRTHEFVRSLSPRLRDDRPLGPDIEAVADSIRDGSLLAAVEAEVGELE